MRRAQKHPELVLAAILLAAAVFWIHAGRQLSFLADEWEFAMDRRDGGLDSFLRAHNGHPVMLLVAYFKVMWSVAGIDRYWPYLVANVALHLVAIALVFHLFRRRAGAVPALAAAALIAFVGHGHGVVAADFQIGFLMSVALGALAFLAAERDGAARGALAAALLVLSIASAGWGLAFAFAVAIQIAARRQWRRLLVPGVPLALYLLWSARYGESVFKWANVPRVPKFVADAFATSFADLGGLSLMWGRVLAGALVVALVAGVLRRGRPRPLELAAMALPLVAWAMTAVVRADIEQATAERYAWVFAMLLLIAVSYLLPRVRYRPVVVLALAAACAGAIATNVSDLRRFTDVHRRETAMRLTKLGALDLVRPAVADDFVLRPFPWFGDFNAREYFEATDAYGRPGYDEGRIRRLGEPLRALADETMLSAAPPAIVPAGSARAAGPDCVRIASATLVLPEDGLIVTPARGAAAQASFRRFGSRYGARRHAIAGRTIVVPRHDLAHTRWTVRIEAAQPFRVCGAAER